MCMVIEVDDFDFLCSKEMCRNVNGIPFEKIAITLICLKTLYATPLEK